MYLAEDLKHHRQVAIKVLRFTLSDLQSDIWLATVTGLKK